MISILPQRDRRTGRFPTCCMRAILASCLGAGVLSGRVAFPVIWSEAGWRPVPSPAGLARSRAERDATAEVQQQLAGGVGVVGWRMREQPGQDGSGELVRWSPRGRVVQAVEGVVGVD